MKFLVGKRGVTFVLRAMSLSSSNPHSTSHSKSIGSRASPVEHREWTQAVASFLDGVRWLLVLKGGGGGGGSAASEDSVVSEEAVVHRYSQALLVVFTVRGDIAIKPPQRFEVRLVPPGRDPVLLLDTGNVSYKTESRDTHRLFSSMDADVKLVTTKVGDHWILTQAHCNIHGLKVLSQLQKPTWLGQVAAETSAEVPSFSAYVTLRRDLLREQEKKSFVVEMEQRPFSLYEIASDNLKLLCFAAELDKPLALEQQPFLQDRGHQHEELVLVADVTVYDRAGCVFKYFTRFLFVQRHPQYAYIYDASSLRRPETLGISLSVQDPSVSEKKLRKSMGGGESDRKMLKRSQLIAVTGSLLTTVSIYIPFQLLAEWQNCPHLSFSHFARHLAAQPVKQ